MLPFGRHLSSLLIGSVAFAHSAAAQSVARFTIVSSALTGEDRITARLRGTNGQERTETPCHPIPGPKGRACFVGPGLRVVRVAVPYDTLPIRVQVPVTVTIQNLSRVASAETSVDLCVNEAGGAECGERRDEFRIPSLRPGENVTVTHMTRIGDQPGQSVRVVALVAPGSARSPSGATPPILLSAPELQFVRAETTNEPRCGGQADVALAIRNISPVAASPETELQFGGRNEGEAFLFPYGTGRGDGGPDTRVKIPAIGPRQTLNTVVRIAGTRCQTAEYQGHNIGSGGRLQVVLDPDHAVSWGERTESEKSWPIVVRP